MLSIFILALGLVAISFAAPLIRLTDAPAIVIAAWRMTLSSLVMLPIFAATLRRRRIELPATRSLFGLSVAAGVFLALHFAFWISSLDYTSVTSSVLLVTMNPIFLGIASPLILKERIGRRTVLGIMLGIIGAAVISLPEIRASPTGRLSSALLGNLLALAGSVMYSAYLLTGRRVRRSLSIVSYTGITYTVAAVVLLLGVAAMRRPLFGYPPRTMLFFALLALVPQLLGHSSFNWALKRFSAPAVSIVIVGEPIGAGLLAWLLLHQLPSLLEVIGGVIILTGIVFAIRDPAGTLNPKPKLQVQDTRCD